MLIKSKNITCYFTLITLVSAVNSSDSSIFSLWNKFSSAIIFNGTSNECNVAFQKVFERAENGDLSALKMLDATGKLPSGILMGNVNQYGNFDECMGVEEAQYCLAEIDLKPMWQRQPKYRKYSDLVHSFHAFQDTFNDPGHRVPAFTSVRWGFCVPAECSSKNFIALMSENLQLPIRVRPGMCQKAVKDVLPSTLGDKITKIFFATLISAVGLSSLITYISHKENLDGKSWNFEKSPNLLLRTLMCFSVQTNMAKLFVIQENDKEIAGLHGIRALSAFGLLMVHKSVCLLFNPYINRTPMIQTLAKPWTIVAKNSMPYTDCFMILSGLLNANALLTDLTKTQSMKFKDKFIARLFRIVPNFIALILFCTYILPSAGNGPLWPVVVSHHSELCKSNMWRNFLFIHNYYGFKDMCLTHTHQLGIDMQLFIMTPVLIYILYISKRVGMFLLLALASISTVLRFWVTYENELTTVAYFGIPISKIFNSADLSYILPTHRATVYLLGVYIAYILQFSKSPPSWNIITKIFVWTFFSAAFLTAWFAPFPLALQSYVYDKFTAALMAAFIPILWGSPVIFTIYMMRHNMAGWLGDFLCWKYFQFATKISYSLYLVQFPVFFYNVGLTKHVDEYNWSFQIVETGTILAAALTLTLLVEIPFLNMRRVWFDKPVKPPKELPPRGVERKSKLG